MFHVYEKQKKKKKNQHGQLLGNQLVAATTCNQLPNMTKLNTITRQPLTFPGCKKVVLFRL